MMNDRRLALILRDAWRVHRLDVIRAVVRQTIVALHALEPRQVLGRELMALEEPPGGPIRAALLACCGEFRDGCGLSEPTETTSLRPPPGALAGGWSHSYANALRRYTDAACEALETSLGDAALTAASGESESA